MPASLYDMDRNLINSSGPGGLEEQRAIQLALELTMLGLNDITSTGGVDTGLDVGLAGHLQFPVSMVDEARNKKSQNMTECVPVPSSEHVAEIVGRQGCKIKALRAKTSTYIKTPVRGEEPVFVVTGRKEDVAKAKKEILSAAEHFSQIRASRKTNLGGLLGSLSPPGPPANIPGQVTIQVRVPYRVVGLVVGPKGATIKRIQQQTHTYIVTPSRDKEPIFEVTGMPENVESARREIEAHIAMRTGAANLTGANLAELLGSPLLEDNTDLLASLCKTGITGFGNIVNYMDPPSNSLPSDALNLFQSTSLTSSTSSGAFSSSGSISSSSSSSGGRLGDLVSIWNCGSVERDEGIGDSPSFETCTTTSSIWSFPPANLPTRPSPTASASPADSINSTKRECLICNEKEVNAALVPCGHNLFCIDCASQLSNNCQSTCPICSRTVHQAIRIIS